MLSRRTLLRGSIAAPFLGSGFAKAAAARQSDLKWAVYYADHLPPSAFEEYELLIFDPGAHPKLDVLKDARKLVFGYLSLGEVAQTRSYFGSIRDLGLLRGENQYWPGSHFVDVRDSRWVKTVIEDLVPAILQRGFQGLFLDTLDNPPELERRDPAKNAGMTDSATRLVRALKLHYPSVPLIMNRGYELLPKLATVVEYVLGESVLADYDFESKRYRRVPDPLYREQVAILKNAQAAAPDLKVLTLDYWDPRDSEAIAAIYREQRGNGFSPYVSVVELDVLVAEPKA